MTWKLAEAKNKFSEVFDKALAGAPQTIARRGERVIVVSEETFAKLIKKKQKPKKNFIEHLLSMPQVPELEIKREKWRARDIKW